MPWRPFRPQASQPYTADFLKESGSLIYAAQQAGSPVIRLFSPQGAGLVMRPQATRVFCGFGSDSGGKGVCYPASDECVPGCQYQGVPEWCDPQTVHLMGNQEGTCYDRPWQPNDMGTLFERAAHNGAYTEVIIDALYWEQHLPDSVEAFYYAAGTPAEQIEHIRQVRHDFLQHYHLDGASNPLLVLDAENWDTPFRGE